MAGCTEYQEAVYTIHILSPCGKYVQYVYNCTLSNNKYVCTNTIIQVDLLGCVLKCMSKPYMYIHS